MILISDFACFMAVWVMVRVILCQLGSRNVHPGIRSAISVMRRPISSQEWYQGGVC